MGSNGVNVPRPGSFLGAGANLALAEFVTRPQAEAQIGAIEVCQREVAFVNLHRWLLGCWTLSTTNAAGAIRSVVNRELPKVQNRTKMAIMLVMD